MAERPLWYKLRPLLNAYLKGKLPLKSWNLDPHKNLNRRSGTTVGFKTSDTEAHIGRVTSPIYIRGPCVYFVFANISLALTILIVFIFDIFHYNVVMLTASIRSSDRPIFYTPRLQRPPGIPPNRPQNVSLPSAASQQSRHSAVPCACYHCSTLY